MEIKLNLVPPDKKREIKEKKQIAVAVKIEIFLSIVFVVFLVMLLAFNYILNLNLSSVYSAQEKSENSGKYEKVKELDENFSSTNQKFSNIIAIKKSQLYWSKLFLKLNSIVFPGIKISSINNSDYFITLQGISDTRDNLILFKEKLANDECFSNVNLPLDDLVGKDNISFGITFILDKNCIKNQ